MKLKIVSVGNKPPEWVVSGFVEYTKRMPHDMRVDLVEIPAPKHHKDHRRVVADEGERTLQAVATGDWVVALDEGGRPVSSTELADKLGEWRMRGADVTFVVGGADGLDGGVRTRANETISLSNLTFPHYMVRVILAEALYRAWTITTGHPYHRP
jgi:23S rRNA (pseudouridine1915-N3)-methyltransferase